MNAYKYNDFNPSSDNQRYQDMDYARSLPTNNQILRIGNNQQENNVNDIPDNEVNESNVDKVLTVFNKFKYVSPIILSQFTSSKLDISSLPK